MDAGAQAPGADLQVEVDLAARPERTDLHDPAQRVEVERTLCTIPGVLGARLVPGYEREVDELHVLLSLDRAPKQAVRDAQTVLMARFGVPSDHRVISVAQLDRTEPVGNTARAVIERVGLSQSGLEVTAEVVLRDADERHEGRADASASGKGQARAVANATLVAASALIGADCRVELEDVHVAEIAACRVAVSLLQVRSPRGASILSGSAVIRDAEPDAIARSVLDGLNRTIGESAGA